MIVKLDGVSLKDEDFEVNGLKKTESYNNKKDFAEEFTFYGEAYDIIDQKLISSPTGKLEKIDVEVYDDCCNSLVIDGEIKGTDLSYCDDECSVKATVYEKNKFLDCLRNFIVSDGISDFNQVDIAAVKELSPFELVLFGLSIFVFAILSPILAFLEIVEKVVNIFRSEKNEVNVPSLSEAIDFVQDFIRPKYYPTPYARSYILNACQKCGLEKGETYTFISSILNDAASPEYNTLYFNAPTKPGNEEAGKPYIQDNRPLDTAADFLDRLSDVFNAEWFVDGNTLFLERRDYRTAGEPVDLTDEVTCYDISEKDIPAYGVIRYLDDGADMAGNEQRQIFDFISDWNTPTNDVQRGREEYLLQFGRAKVVLYTNKAADLISTFGFGVSPNVFGALLRFFLRGNFLYISQYTPSQPKLLTADSNGALLPPTNLYGGALYSKYFYIDNPRHPDYKVLSFEVEIDLDCSDPVKKGRAVRLKKGLTFAEEVITDYSKNKQTIKGKI